jgi:hypothetical protein
MPLKYVSFIVGKIAACLDVHDRMQKVQVRNRTDTFYPCMQVKEDVYEKIDKELLEYVEDVLLNRRPDATERLLEFAATLDPKSKPCAVRRLGLVIPPKVCRVA